MDFNGAEEGRSSGQDNRPGPVGGLTKLLLTGAILMPLIYFGIQLALAPLFPGYDVMKHPASLLGSDLAVHARWFNAAAILSGIAAIAGAAGLYRVLRGVTPNWLRVLLAIAVVLTGCSNIWAGIFTMPDPRHGANPLMPAMLSVPILLCAAAWLGTALRPLRAYLSLNLLLFALCVPVMARITPIDMAQFGGLVQRIVALVLMLPIGVAGWRLLHSTSSRSSGEAVEPTVSG